MVTTVVDHRRRIPCSHRVPCNGGHPAPPASRIDMLRFLSSSHAVHALIALSILASGVFLYRGIVSNPPVAETREQAAALPHVEAITLATDTFPITLSSQGTAEPAVRMQLVPGIAGRVEVVGDAFEVGASFREGDLLVAIDARDYRIAVLDARARLAEAEASLQNEEAEAKRALEDWRSLGHAGTPSDLTLRKPQLASAAASAAAAEAQVQRAELDLERTRILAPWDGRVSERKVELGQFAAANAVLGEICRQGSFEVRLPLDARQFGHLSSEQLADSDIAVSLDARIGDRTHRWQGQLVRSEDIDPTTQQLFVVARVDDPVSDQGLRLRSGQFLDAVIAASTLEDAVVIPHRALTDSGDVQLLTPDNRIERRQVTLAASNNAGVAVTSGLDAGERLIVTPLPGATDGTPVQAAIDGKAADNDGT